MAKKKVHYTPALGQLFLKLCQMGKSLTQIAVETGVTKARWLGWNENPKNYDLHAIWERGKESCQSYHESLLDTMIKEGASGPVIEAQKYRLRVMFKEDWSDKQESKIEMTTTSRLSDQELQAQLEKMLVKPSARTLYLVTDSNASTEASGTEKDSNQKDDSQKA